MLRKFGRAGQAAAAIAAAAVVLTGVATTANAAPEKTQIGGGSGIILNGNTACSLTTIGHDDANRLVGITAGHCGEVGSPVAAEYTGGHDQIGTVAMVDHNLDIAVIEFDANRVQPVNRVGNVTITEVGPPANFPDIACKEGRTTGNTCGIVWGTDPNYAETWNQICVNGGDSGAPVVVGSRLVGMINAYIFVPCIGPAVGTTMDATLASINAHGGVGAGFRVH
ncbi:hypothetical protein [Tomitella biformata]|uniref:hypothetical protein n=1 Tax=Tomitella biformata TaxID=630403 RepID=UPI00046554E6|nr:hypothetical protein [Tomitella biformata]